MTVATKKQPTRAEIRQRLDTEQAEHVAEIKRRVEALSEMGRLHCVNFADDCDLDHGLAFPEEARELEDLRDKAQQPDAAELLAPILGLIARAVYCADASALAELRHALMSAGIYGAGTQQVADCDAECLL